jgi:tetratricopeptide (TPR) repeat protein
MDIDVEEKRRNVIPRWRDFKTTLALGELESVGKQITTVPPKEEGHIDDQIEDWRRNQSLAFATDLVGAAFVLGITDDIEEAAQFIISAESQSNDLQKRIARQAIDKDFCRRLLTLDDVHLNSREIIEQSKENVRRRRAQLQQSLRDPIKLVELSREYATLGSLDKAVRTMEIAVALAPANRFVLRSAARLFVHANLIEKAHYILRRAPSLRFDPWLLSAEIAVSSMRNLTSANVSRGIAWANNSDFHAFDLSELSSAVATVEMNHGSVKNARKLFRKALKMPTDNSIAQVEWASRRSVEFDLDLGQFDIARNFEAPAWKFFSGGNMEDALKLGKSWILDQPFAVSPVNFVGMVAGLTEEFDLANEIYSFGLRANPENATLRNNLAFTLASSDRPIEAQKELDRIDRMSPDLTIQQKIVIIATEGLIKFRMGFAAEGRSLYTKAMEFAKENNEPGYALRAMLYLAKEEINTETSDALTALEKVENEAKKYNPSQEMTIMLHRLKSYIENHPEKFEWLRLKDKHATQPR